MVCGGYSQESANTLLASGVADAVAFGQAFIANRICPNALLSTRHWPKQIKVFGSVAMSVAIQTSRLWLKVFRGY